MAKKTIKKATKKARKTVKARKVKRGKRKPPRRPARKPARAKKQRGKPSRPAKVASAFQIMIDTINETERLRAKNERRDVTDETG